MADPETRKILQELLNNDTLDNKSLIGLLLSVCLPNASYYFIFSTSITKTMISLCRLWSTSSSMGFRQLCCFHLPSMRWLASRLWCSHQVFSLSSLLLCDGGILIIFLSFVRSVSMDAWQQDQLRRMKVCMVSYLDCRLMPQLFFPTLLLCSLEAMPLSKSS